MNYINKTILITGGTGSFGTNFIKIFLNQYKVKRIRVYSRDEQKQSVLLNQYKNDVDCFIGDVRDKDRLRRAMEGVDIVLHAAALKMVQSCEYNPFETIKTNILGSMNVIDCALDMGIYKLLAISTDKAAAPLNLYGATKMCMEKLFVNANNYRGIKKTKISCVRYGNVAGARGSVIPLWRENIKNNIPIILNNRKSTRFWMNIEEAIQFVIDSLMSMDICSGGEIYVPKLASFNIMDLLKCMIPEGYPFIITSDRIGDKVHETLILSNEMQHTVKLKDKYIIYPEEPHWEYIKPKGEDCNGKPGYSSDNNERFLTQQEIKERISTIA